MDANLVKALRRAKNLLAGEQEAETPEDSKEILKDFDMLVTEARNYLITKLADSTTNTEELEVEITFCVGDAEVCFEMKA
jgi:hypothetical protein